VAPTRPTASAALATRDRLGSRRTGAIDVPANSHVAQITTIITVSTAILAAASVVGESARWALAKTAAIATQAFGLAMPRSAPPMSEQAFGAPVGFENAAAAAMRYATSRMYAAVIPMST